MDTQQIVLIVLGILYFLFRSSGSKDKKKQSAPQGNTSEKRTTSIEDILRELSGETARPVQQAPVAEKRHEEPVVVPETKKVRSRERHTPSPKLRVVNLPPLVDVNNAAITEDENVEFNLRQAIIYDAILNRPHQ